LAFAEHLGRKGIRREIRSGGSEIAAFLVRESTSRESSGSPLAARQLQGHKSSIERPVNHLSRTL